MPAARFVEQLNTQIGNELAAHNQYLACAVYYDALTMPRMAAFFYEQALEERDHAMMMIQYLLDTDSDVVIPGVEAVSNVFADLVAPVASRSSRRSGSPSRSTACSGPRARSPTSPPSSSCSGSSRSRSRRSRR